MRILFFCLKWLKVSSTWFNSVSEIKRKRTLDDNYYHDTHQLIITKLKLKKGAIQLSSNCQFDIDMENQTGNTIAKYANEWVFVIEFFNSRLEMISPTEETENCYLLRASIGDSREAFHAGNKPAPKLKSTESTHTVERSCGRNTGVMLACAPPPPPPTAGARGARPELNK